MKCLFQLVESATGVRSPAVSCVRAEFARRLISMVAEAPETASDYVLVLIDDDQFSLVDGDGKTHVNTNWQFSRAPMMTVRSFIEKFAEVPAHG